MIIVMRKILTILIAVLSSAVVNPNPLLGECLGGNCVNGKGTFIYGPNTKWAGDIYSGEYKDDKRHGQGTYTWASGDQYVGGWRNNEKHGQGTYTFANGNTRTGIWAMGEYKGTAKEVEEKRQADMRENSKKAYKYRKIYNACILDKGADADMTSTTIRRAVEQTCQAIASNPSFFESWKYE